MAPARERASEFCRRFGLVVPILSPRWPAAPPFPLCRSRECGRDGRLRRASARARGDSAGSGRFSRAAIARLSSICAIPDPPPRRDKDQEREVARFLAGWGPDVPEEAGDPVLRPDFEAQCDAMLAARPAVISSIICLSAEFVARMKHAGIAWFAAVTTVGEAKAAEAAGADVVAPGVRSRRPSGGFRACAGGAPGGRTVFLAARRRRRRRHSGCRRWRRRRWPGDRRGADPWRQRGADRHGLLAMPGGEDPCRLGRRDRPHSARRHNGVAGIQRPARAERRDRLRDGCDRSRRPAPGPTRYNAA